jgi:hypothetical protein
MRKYSVLSVLVVGLCSFGVSQSVPSDPGAIPAPAATPAAVDPAQPQKEMPPDQKAPTPVATAAPSNPEPSPTPVPVSTGPRYLIAGTDIRASLDSPLSTKTSKVGDRFTATIVYPVHDSSGNIVVPVGSKLNGQISEPDQKVEGAIKDIAHLSLRFTDIQLPTGTDVPLSANLISVHNNRPATAATSENSHLTGSSAIAANGGFTGLGRPLKGLAVGKLAGGGYILSPTGKQVALPAECIMRLRIDRNTTVE